MGWIIFLASETFDVITQYSHFLESRCWNERNSKLLGENQRLPNGVELAVLKDVYGKLPIPAHSCCHCGQECFTPVPSKPEPDCSRDGHELRKARP